MFCLQLYPSCGKPLFSLPDYVTEANVVDLPLADLITVGCYINHFRNNELPNSYVPALLEKLAAALPQSRLIDLSEFVPLMGQKALFEDNEEATSLFDEVLTANIDRIVSSDCQTSHLHLSSGLLETLKERLDTALTNDEYTRSLALYLPHCTDESDLDVVLQSYDRRLENFDLSHIVTLLRNTTQTNETQQQRQSGVIRGLASSLYQQFLRLRAAHNADESAGTSRLALQLECRALLYQAFMAEGDAKSAQNALLADEDTPKSPLTLRAEDDLIKYYTITAQCSEKQITQLVTSVVDFRHENPAVQRARLRAIYQLFNSLEIEDVFLARKLYEHAKPFFYEAQQNQDYLSCVNILDDMLETGVYPRKEIKLLLSKTVTAEIYDYLRKYPQAGRHIRSSLTTFSETLQRKNYLYLTYCIVLLSPFILGFYATVRSYVKTFASANEPTAAEPGK